MPKNQIEQIHKVALIVRTMSDEPLAAEAIAETLRALIHTHRKTNFLVAQAQAEEVYRQQH